VQLDRELLWKYFDRFKNLLAQCPHHGLDQASLCQIVYEGLDQQTRTMVESMWQGGFLPKSARAAWEFLEDLVEKTMQWATAHDDNLSSRISRGGLHSISNVSHLESKITVMENMLEGLSPQMSQMSQTSTVSCSHCEALDHSLSACPYFAHQLATRQEQASMAFQRPKNDLFFPYYNPRWRNHPNFSWSNGLNVAIPNSQPISYPPNSFQRPDFLGVPNAPRPPPPIAQAQAPPGYTDIDRTEMRINSNVERMISANMEKIMRMMTE